MDTQDLDHGTLFRADEQAPQGFPSETGVKRGVRVVHGDKELEEKVGRNDLCPCGSAKLFKKCCRNSGCFRRREPGPLLLGNENTARSVHENRAGLSFHQL